MHRMNTTKQQKKKNECSHPHDNRDEFQMHYTEGKKPVSKATQYMIPFTYHHGKGKTIGAVDSCIEGHQGLELGRL